MRRIDGRRLSYVEVNGKETISLKYFPILLWKKLVVDINDFLNQLDNEIYNAYREDLNLWGVEPFNIVICVY